MSRDDRFEFRGTVKRETEAAALVETDDGAEIWIPFSHIHEIHGDGRLVVTKWIATQKGLL